MATVITVKTPSGKEAHVVEDYSFGEQWLSLTINEFERTDYHVAYIEYVQIQEVEDD